MTTNSPRLIREHKTIDIMLNIYCRGQHQTAQGLCSSCQALQAYAHLRLEKCPYQEKKTTCAHCPTHCYNKQMRERIRAMMRYAGPRMLLRSPRYALLHILDGFRRPAVLPRRQKPQAND